MSSFISCWPHLQVHVAHGKYSESLLIVEMIKTNLVYSLRCHVSTCTDIHILLHEGSIFWINLSNVIEMKLSEFKWKSVSSVSRTGHSPSYNQFNQSSTLTISQRTDTFLQLHRCVTNAIVNIFHGMKCSLHPCSHHTFWRAEGYSHCLLQYQESWWRWWRPSHLFGGDFDFYVCYLMCLYSTPYL